MAIVKQKRENQMKVQYVGFDIDEDWISMDENAYPKKARKYPFLFFSSFLFYFFYYFFLIINCIIYLIVLRYSNSVTGGCILERGDKIEVMWRDKEKEKQYSEPFGWFDATVLDIRDFSV